MVKPLGGHAMQLQVVWLCCACVLWSPSTASSASPGPDLFSNCGRYHVGSIAICLGSKILASAFIIRCVVLYGWSGVPVAIAVCFLALHFVFGFALGALPLPRNEDDADDDDDDDDDDDV